MKNKPPGLLSYFLPSFGDMLWLSAFFGVLLRGRRMINADGDLALHLNLGHYILDTGKIPLRDVFSHTMPGQPVTQHEWLTTVIFAFINKIFDLDGIIFLCALIIGVTIFLIYRRLRNSRTTLLPVLIVALLVLANSMSHWLARPHIITFLLLTIWMMVLDQLYKGKSHRWWLLPLLMLFWVNLHGGFIVGFITWFIYGIGIAWDLVYHKLQEGEKLPSHFWKYFALGGVTSFLTSLINPSGFGLWKTVVGHVGNKFLANVTHEFLSPDFHDVTYWPFLIFIALLIFVLGFSRRKPDTPLLFNTIAWLMMGLYSRRNIPLFVIIAAPLLARGMDNLLANSNAKLLTALNNLDLRMKTLDQHLKGYFWPALSIGVAIIGLILGFRFDLEGQGYAFDPEVFPIEAVEWLEEHPQDGEMFNYFTWGGYLEYRLWPEYRVFIDSKSDFFGEDFVRQYGKVILQQEGWENVLDQYDVNWAILPANEAAVRAIQSEVEWETIYQDGTAIILRKR